MERYEYLRKINLQSIYLKIQKTSPSEGFHNWHTENSDSQNFRRVLATTVYLNDVEEGGETEFLYLSRRGEAKGGASGDLASWFPLCSPWKSSADEQQIHPDLVVGS